MKFSNSRFNLDRLLEERNHQPEQTIAIDTTIWQTFGTTCAVLVLDMSGFSRLTNRHGIIHFLGMMQRLKAIALPLIARYKGTLVKFEADNLYATFPDAPEAVDASLALVAALNRVNTTLPDSQDLYVSLGIGYGDILLVEGQDFYGSEINFASKLGEDLARANEILLTAAAFARLNPVHYKWERLEMAIAGLELTAYRTFSRV